MADTLRVQPFAKVALTRNGVTLAQQIYEPEDESFTEHSADRLVLDTNMATAQGYDLTYIGTSQHLFMVSSKTVSVGLDNQTTLWDVEYLALKGSFTTLYLQNTSSTETTVELIVVD